MSVHNTSIVTTPKFNDYCSKAVKIAQKEFNASSVSVNEYAKMTNQDRQSASELDFNFDDKISIWERASELVAKKFFTKDENELVPTMLSHYIYAQTNLHNDDVYNSQKPSVLNIDYFS